VQNACSHGVVDPPLVVVMIRRHSVVGAMLLLGLLLQMAVVMSRITLQGV
jgi:hypothetical protein